MNTTASQVFNPEQFLGMEVTDANSTEFVLVPEAEYVGVLQGISAENFKEFDIKQGPNAGGKFRQLSLTWDINDESGELAQQLGMPPRVRQSIGLDINSQGGLDMGKGRNVDLGRLREALGLNNTGQPFGWNMLGGRMARIKVKHRIDQKTGKTYAEVKEVAKV